MVVMNYKIDGEINTAEIPLNSRRFAKKGFFTISKYFIERSNPIRTEIEADSLLNPEIAPIPSEFTAEQLLEIPSINPNFANQQEMEIEEDSSHHFPNQENLDLNMQLLAHDMQDGDNMLPFIWSAYLFLKSTANHQIKRDNYSLMICKMKYLS